jgi:hypothetical protein
LPEQVAAFLDLYGWNQVEQLGALEFTARYVAPSTRTLPVSDLERSVLAVKTGSAR